MMISAKYPFLYRGAGLALAGMAVLATVHHAAAEEGLGGFLQSIFGGGAGEQVAAPAPAPAYQRSYRLEPAYRQSPVRFRSSHQRPLTFRPSRERPLTVTLRKTPSRLVVAQMPVRPGRTSIYEDRTLKRGDAVMTTDGIRVFAGSASWPYTKADFVGLTTARDLSKDTLKVLAEVDRLPRN